MYKSLLPYFEPVDERVTAFEAIVINPETEFVFGVVLKIRVKEQNHSVWNDEEECDQQSKQDESNVLSTHVSDTSIIQPHSNAGTIKAMDVGKGHDSQNST